MKEIELQSVSEFRFCQEGLNKKYYENINPIDQKTLNEKIEILNNVNNYLRSKDNNVKQVTANFLGEQKSIEIIRSGGETLADIRPLVRFNVTVMLEILLLLAPPK